MKAKTFLIALVVLTVLTSLSYAKIWIVDNNGGSKIADFTTIQAAHDGAADGDTIYVIGSTKSYGGSEDIMISKKIVLIGPGFFLNENHNLHYNTLSATLSKNVQFNEGSEGSTFMGFIFENKGVHVAAFAESIIIKRNKLGLLLNEFSNNCIITQNYFPAGVYFHEYPSNILFTNNIVESGAYTFGSNNAHVIFKNNIFDVRTILAAHSQFSNNIFIDCDIPSSSGGVQCINNSFEYNICTNQLLSDYPTNILGVDVTSIFVGKEGYTTDSQWQLKDGSPAIGAGLNSADCGVFAGDNPYVLSGMPPIPAIYEAYIATTGSIDDGLPVKIKVKAHN